MKWCVVDESDSINLANKFWTIDEGPIRYQSRSPNMYAKWKGGNFKAEYSHASDRFGREHDTNTLIDRQRVGHEKCGLFVEA